MKTDITWPAGILDRACEIVYVVAIDTYELLYANQRAKEWKATMPLSYTPSISPLASNGS